MVEIFKIFGKMITYKPKFVKCTRGSEDESDERRKEEKIEI